MSYPTDDGFKAPKLDFFKPTLLRNRSDFVGVELKGQRYRWITRDYDDNSRKPKQEVTQDELPRGVISGVYVNDLGGITVGFSENVTYAGNFGGGVELGFPPDGVPWSFNYDQVARVRKPDGTVVWENSHVPKKRRTLKSD